jgi:hypothetical protein
MLARYDVTAAQDLSDGVERLDGFLAQRTRPVRAAKR